MSEILPKVSATVRAFGSRDLPKCLIAALTCGIGGLTALDAGFVAAENSHKLSGLQIRARFTGKELTDEVHWRDVYERDGTLRHYSMGSKKVGKWSIQGDNLCVDLPEPDGGCFEVALSRSAHRHDANGAGVAVRWHSSDHFRSEVREDVRRNLRSTSSDIAAGTFL